MPGIWNSYYESSRCQIGKVKYVYEEKDFGCSAQIIFRFNQSINQSDWLSRPRRSDAQIIYLYGGWNMTFCYRNTSTWSFRYIHTCIFLPPFKYIHSVNFNANICLIQWKMKQKKNAKATISVCSLSLSYFQVEIQVSVCTLYLCFHLSLYLSMRK